MINVDKVYKIEADDANFFRNSIFEVTKENIDYDINVSTSTLLFNMTSRNTQDEHAHILKEDYSFLTPEVKRIWGKTLNNIEAISSQGRSGNHNDRVNKHNKNSCKLEKSPSFTPKKFAKANFHGLLSELISNNFFV